MAPRAQGGRADPRSAHAAAVGAAEARTALECASLSARFISRRILVRAAVAVAVTTDAVATIAAVAARRGGGARSSPAARRRYVRRRSFAHRASGR